MNEIQGKFVLVNEPITAKMIFRSSDEQLFGECDGMGDSLQSAEIIVSTEQFGHGRISEKEIARLKDTGIKAIIARDFGRQFFRYAVNTGLPLFTAEIPATVNDNADIAISLTKGTIALGDEVFKTQAYPRFLRECITHGSLVAVARQMLGKS